MKVKNFALFLLVLLLLLLALPPLASAGRTFNGTSDVATANGIGTSLDISSGPETVSFWWYVTNVSVSQTAVAHWNGASNSQFQVGLGVAPFTPVTQFSWIVGCCGAFGPSYGGCGTATINTLYHIVMYIDTAFGSTGIQVTTVNGSVVCTSSVGGTSTRSPGGANFTVGATSTPSSSFASGIIGEVGVWNVKLTPQEISATTFSSPLLVRRTALVGYFPLYGNSSPEPDLSGHELNLTLTGTTPASMEPPIAPVSFHMRTGLISTISQLGQFTTLTGQYVDGQGNLISGKLVLRLPFAGATTLEGAVFSPVPISFPIYSGSIFGYSQIIPNDDILPAQTYYIADLYDSYGTLVEENYVHIPIGATFNMGAAIQTSVNTSNVSYINPANLSGNNTWVGNNTTTATWTFNGPVVFTGSITQAFSGIPTLTALTGAGTSPTLTVGTGSRDVGGIITLVEGTAPASNTGILQLVFASGHTRTWCTVSPANSSAAGVNTTLFLTPPSGTPTFFQLNTTGTLSAGVTYIWIFNCQFTQ